jgi:hypothetical protein
VFIAISQVDPLPVAIMQFVTKQFNPDGSVAWAREATPKNIRAEIEKSGVPIRSPSSWRIIDPGELPKDRTFRDAWRDRAGALEHDMKKVRTIHLERIRKRRDRELQETDGPWLRANEQGDTAEVERLKKQRQRLRDLPDILAPELEAASTPEAVAKIGAVDERGAYGQLAS